MQNNKTKIEELGKRIENLIKEDIKKKNLIDTGRLLNSVRAKVLISSDLKFSIEFETMEYFDYVDKKNNIIKDVTNSKSFEKIVDEVREILLKKYEEEIYKSFENNKK